MVKVIHCAECYRTAEIRSDNETDIYNEPAYCPFCGTNNEPDRDIEEDDYDEF